MSSIEQNMTRAPRPFDVQMGADALGALPKLSAPLAELVQGAAGSSPYLAGLIQREAAWLPQAMEAPREALKEVLQEPGDDVKSQLRRAKRRVALLAGLADLAGAWSLSEVTSALTELADFAVQAALDDALAVQYRRGKLPELGRPGIFVLAMGKMGAHELNYSSDIDLICLFDETLYDPEHYSEIRRAFVRAIQQCCASLSDLTAEGYVFRTDLRLRPDPSVTPAVMSAGAAMRYYESLGRSWERAAYIKARVCAGDREAGAEFLSELSPFIWRRHLDFAAVQDAHDMRLAIRAHKGTGGPITLEGHNMKLGRGGIREIEFFTQTRQLISGGRDMDLRERGTVAGLSALARKGWVDAQTAQELSSHYEFARMVEHRVQMINDAQTHALPKTEEGFDRLAALMGRERLDLQKELKERLSAVHETTEGFFAPAEPQQDQSPEDQLDAQVKERWLRYPALRSARAVSLFDRIEPHIARRLSQAGVPGEALAAMEGFLSRLPAGVQLFALFEANPQLIDFLVDIIATSPALARYLSENAEVLDAVISGGFFAPFPQPNALFATIDQKLDAAQDYETQLDLLRIWSKELHFRIGVQKLKGMMDEFDAAKAYADLASVCVKALWPRVQSEFARRHGPPPGEGAIIVGMGSLGAQCLTASSDLDLIVIYDAAGVESSDGKKPLVTKAYYARLTQMMITALTVRTSQGRLYEADMRLRPSGNQGPVATSWAAYESYQKHDAWLWEHMALTRAQVVAGPERLSKRFNTLREAVLKHERAHAQVFEALAEMRRRIAQAKPVEDIWDAKIGRGRLQDIELTAQSLTLLTGYCGTDVLGAFGAAQEAGLINSEQCKTLCAAYRLFWRTHMAIRIVASEPVVPNQIGAAGRSVLFQAVLPDHHKSNEAAATAHLTEVAQSADAVISTFAALIPDEDHAGEFND